MSTSKSVTTTQVQVLGRMFRIIAALRDGEVHALKDIALKAGLHTSTCCRILSDMMSEGMVVMEKKRAGKYQLNRKYFEDLLNPAVQITVDPSKPTPVSGVSGVVGWQDKVVEGRRS